MQRLPENSSFSFFYFFFSNNAGVKTDNSFHAELPVCSRTFKNKLLAKHTSGLQYYLPPSHLPVLMLLTQINTVVPVDLHPEGVHPGVPLRVRVPQHLAVQVHDFLTLSLRVLRHVYRAARTPVCR